MNFYEEREKVEKLRENRENIVFWKKDLAFEKNGVIVCEKKWTTDRGYLLGSKLYEIGSNDFLCESWIDEDYLNEICKGENIVVITE